jgi:hypothetical protein
MCVYMQSHSRKSCGVIPASSLPVDHVIVRYFYDLLAVPPLETDLVVFLPVVSFAVLGPGSRLCYNKVL